MKIILLMLLFRLFIMQLRQGYFKSFERQHSYMQKIILNKNKYSERMHQ
jgi:hypothetical protein